MTMPEILAGHCRHYYETVMQASDPPSPSSQDEYKEALRRGFRLYTDFRLHLARQFIDAAMVARWGELDDAATRFAQNPGHGSALNENGRLGARDFLGMHWQAGELARQIGGAGLGNVGRRPDPSTGFGFLGPNDRTYINGRTRLWRQLALSRIGHSRYWQLSDRLKNYLRDQVRNARRLYVALLYNHPLQPSYKDAYIQALRNRPADIWGAYLKALVPATPATGVRLALTILTGWDPRSGSPPPRSAAQSMIETFLSGFGISD